jgi:hypothetical protein
MRIAFLSWIAISLGIHTSAFPFKAVTLSVVTTDAMPRKADGALSAAAGG